MKKTVVMISVVLGLIGAIVPSVSAQDEIVFHQNYNVIKGAIALQNGEAAKASKYLKRALNANIGTNAKVHVYSNLCAAELLQDNLDTAKSLCDRAIKLDRLKWEAYINRGHVYRIQGEDKLAKADYAKAQKLKPGEEISQRFLAQYTAVEKTRLATNEK